MSLFVDVAADKLRFPDFGRVFEANEKKGSTYFRLNRFELQVELKKEPETNGFKRVELVLIVHESRRSRRSGLESIEKS
jgi:hypothetical protein